jgi:DNA-binding CsgD family transcriptional regulator
VTNDRSFASFDAHLARMPMRAEAEGRIRVTQAGRKRSTSALPARETDGSGVTAVAARHLRILNDAEHTAGLGTWSWTPETGDVLWSDNLFRLFGLEPVDTAPRPEYVISRMFPDDRQQAQEALAALITGELRDHVLEYRIVREAGATHYHRLTLATIEAAPRRIVGSVQDVTVLQSRSLHRPLAAHLAVSRALDNWTSLEQGAELLLANLAAAMELSFGAFWLPQDSSLTGATICHTSAPGLERMVELTCAPGPASIPALVNRAFVSRQPTVSTLGPTNGLTRRDAEIRQARLQGAIAIPAVCVDQTFAVIELLSFSPVVPTERLLSALDGIGHELGRFLKRHSGQLSAPALTPREFEVLQLAAQGQSAAAIATQLYLSTATIKRHFESAYAALGVSDRASAVGEAMRRGLIT